MTFIMVKPKAPRLFSFRIFSCTALLGFWEDCLAGPGKDDGGGR